MFQPFFPEASRALVTIFSISGLSKTPWSVTRTIRSAASSSTRNGIRPLYDPFTPMKDHVIAITGASKGIGAELARQLAAKGSKLVLAARSEKELEEVAATCKNLGASVVTVKADVTHERDCQAIIAGAMVAYGRLDALVNN